MKLRQRWERLVPLITRRNLAAFSLGGVILGGLLIGSADIFDASGNQTHRQTGQQEQEEASDQVILREAKSNPDVVFVTGITPQTDHKAAYVQAENNHKTAGVLRNLAGSSLACAAGLGMVAAVRRRRQNRAEAIVSVANSRESLAAFAERRKDEKRTRLPIIPYIKPEGPTIDTVRQEVQQIELSTNSMLDEIKALTAQTRAETGALRATREIPESLDAGSLDERIFTIYQEHTIIKAEMELGRQATLRGFANLRTELGLPPAPEQPPAVSYPPVFLQTEPILVMA